ncbi:hypothetical protein PV402_39450 [Streptomyces scabiei]|uniref:hypothetical protein n=1 Tax=Streptomyces scabiei TaxID=1930 RepID=UPI0029ABE2C6|nr:hypothetical protein [Streptomyces scabiei]MDX2658264.1 hypothetical protein [Streptomyces scabiei]MDX2870549.1 hypothetical protein [Streptomyces scabiei]
MENRIGQSPPSAACDATPSTQPAVLERFSAGGPRGSWPAEEFAADRRAEGLNVTVTMDLATDSFLVKQVP